MPTMSKTASARLLPLLTSAALLAGCAGAPKDVPMPVAPPPAVTPDVLKVQAASTAHDPSINLKTAFETWGMCIPESRVWEELEPGRVAFVCHYDDATQVQFEFRVTGGDVKLTTFYFTSQNDADFSGMSVRGEEAEAALDAVYKNKDPLR